MSIHAIFSDFFGKPAEIHEKFPTDREHDFPFDHIVIVDCHIPEADGLLHGFTGRGRESLDPRIAPLGQNPLSQRDKISRIQQMPCQQPGVGRIITQQARPLEYLP